MNVAIRDPASLDFNPITGYLTSRECNSWVLSTLLGEVTYYSTDGNKQICVTPSAHGWHRFVAVLAQVYNQETLFFSSYKEGVSFGGLFNKAKTNKRHAKATSAPIEGLLLKEGKDSKCKRVYGRSFTLTRTQFQSTMAAKNSN